MWSAGHQANQEREFYRSMSLSVKYCGSALDYSGYGEANRHDIAALVSAGIDVTCQVPKYTPEISDFGKLGEMVRERANKKIPYHIKILHTTPNVYPAYYEPNVYHIGRVFWETDKLPDDFARPLALVDEIWTGSEFNAKAIRKAGVQKPIHIIPEAIDTSLDVDSIVKYTIDEPDSFKFYSIFEWTERKNPLALLEAYWREFEGDKNVGLYLKTYVDGFTPDKKVEIDTQIRKLKAKLNLSHYAPLYLFRKLMDRNQIYRFHKTFDCFVSSHRGEGWGIPQMEAMLMGKPVISTNCGGIHEYVEDKVDGMLVSHTLTPIVENTRNQQWYCQDQNWATINIDGLRNAMRSVYSSSPTDVARMGEAARKNVIKRFSTEVVGQLMKSRLETIAKERDFQ